MVWRPTALGKLHPGKILLWHPHLPCNGHANFTIIILIILIILAIIIRAQAEADFVAAARLGRLFPGVFRGARRAPRRASRHERRPPALVREGDIASLNFAVAFPSYIGGDTRVSEIIIFQVP